jgi:DNA modification methylase
LAARLIELHRVLKPQGSLFLHCDPTASHYIKITLDCIFGRDKMVSEISWQRSGPKGHATRRIPNARDIIFWYAKSDSWTFNPPYIKHSRKYLKSAYRYIEEDTGRRYRLGDVTNPNKNRPNLEYEWKGVKRVWRWTRDKMEAMDQAGRLVYSPNGIPSYKRYLDEMPGVPVTNNWTDIAPLQGQSKEYMGYPTQKPRKLLERIIKMASNPGDVVLDPFCGCGTAIEAAEALERNWIGIDITLLAIRLIQKRLTDTFTTTQYTVHGKPSDLYEAQELAKQNEHQFEYWAVDLVGGRPPGITPKKGADQNIDGVMFFKELKTRKQQKVLIQVKSGKVGVKDIREFAHTLNREKAAIGLFITLEDPTKPMLAEAVGTGFYKMQTHDDLEISYPKLQILTIADLLAGMAKPQLPIGASAGFKTASREKENPTEKMQNMFAMPAVASDDDDDELMDDDE